MAIGSEARTSEKVSSENHEKAMALDGSDVEHLDQPPEFPDPDEGKSAEERAACVCGLTLHRCDVLAQHSILGSQGFVESRSLVGTLAELSVSGFVCYTCS
jgi:hypothetical protein